MSETVAAIDCGTNTIKLLDRRPARRRGPRDADRPARPGRRRDRPAGRRGARARTFAALDEYAALIARARRRPGSGSAPPRRPATPRTPTSSPRASARGSASPRRCCPAPRRPRSPSTARSATCATTPRCPVLVVDIGGGSTELILGASLTAPPSAADSMDIGSVRLHERHLRSDPPTAGRGRRACVADIDRHLDACPVSPARAATVVGVAGTVTVGGGRRARPAGVRPRRGRPGGAAGRRGARAGGPAGRDDRRRAAGAALAAPRPGRRDRRRRADPVAGAAAYAGRASSSSPRPTSSTGSPGRSFSGPWHGAPRSHERGRHRVGSRSSSPSSSL